jgi:hypothetical protein
MWPFDQNNQQMYQQYAQAYNNGNYSGFDPYQSFGHVQRFMQGAPYDMQQQIYQQHFEQMPYEQRALLAQRVPPQYGMDINNPASMAQSLALMGQQQPGLLHHIFNHPILLGSGIALAALIAKHVIAHHERERFEQQQQYGYGQDFQGPQYGYNQQDQYLQQQLNEERREVQELRRELWQEEQRDERMEERERHHHHHREDYF